MNKIKRLDEGQIFKCEKDKCLNEATRIVYVRSEVYDVIFLCDKHTEEIQNDERPEYWENCPNCGCEYGVN